MPTGKSREKMREEVANLCNLSNTAVRGDCEKLGLEKCDSNPGPMVQKRHRRALKRRPEESCQTTVQSHALSKQRLLFKNDKKPPRCQFFLQFLSDLPKENTPGDGQYGFYTSLCQHLTIISLVIQL